MSFERLLTLLRQGSQGWSVSPSLTPLKWKQLEGRGEEAAGGQLLMTEQSAFSCGRQIRDNHSK